MRNAYDHQRWEKGLIQISTLTVKDGAGVRSLEILKYCCRFFFTFPHKDWCICKRTRNLKPPIVDSSSIDPPPFEEKIQYLLRMSCMQKSSLNKYGNHPILNTALSSPNALKSLSHVKMWNVILNLRANQPILFMFVWVIVLLASLIAHCSFRMSLVLMLI